MTDHEPTPEAMLAPLAKPTPRPGPPPASALPNRVPNMPPRPAPAELTRPTDAGRSADTQRPAEPVRFGEFGRPQSDASRAGEAARPTELPRRPSEPPRAAEQNAAGTSSAPRQEAEIRQLIVGKEISLKGEVTSCDRLLIEGSVEANLSDCRDVEISESGLFKGSASIETAEILGRFEGTLTVRKRLFIRATGRVTGTIRYGQIEIERGGRIAGDIEAADEPAAAAAAIPSRFG